jgi:hypothetical protein
MRYAKLADLCVYEELRESVKAARFTPSTCLHCIHVSKIKQDQAGHLNGKQMLRQHFAE